MQKSIVHVVPDSIEVELSLSVLIYTLNPPHFIVRRRHVDRISQIPPLMVDILFIYFNIFVKKLKVLHTLITRDVPVCLSGEHC